MIRKQGHENFVSGYFEEETGFQLELADFHNSSLAIDISPQYLRFRLFDTKMLAAWNSQ
jgi:hypothetical protein